MNYTDEEFKLPYFDTKLGRSRKWIGMDTKKLFDRNKKLYPDNYSVKYFTDNPITYNLNSDFFRTPDDFNSNDTGNIFLGCSHTFGTGHHIEDTWGYKLSNKIGGKFWNLSIGGSGFMAAFRVFMHFVDKLKVDNVFFYMQYPFRYEYFYEGSWRRFGLWNFKEGVFDPNDPLAKTFYNHRTAFTISSMVLKSLSYECDKRGIDFYFDNRPPDTPIPDDELSDKNEIRARDLRHMAVYRQHLLYETFLDLYESNKIFKKIEKTMDIFGGTQKKYYI